MGCFHIHAAVVGPCVIDWKNREVLLFLGELAFEASQDDGTLIVVQILLVLVLAVLGQFVAVDGVDGLTLLVEDVAGGVEVEGDGFGGGVVVVLEVEVDVFAGGVGGVGAAIGAV